MLRNPWDEGCKGDARKCDGIVLRPSKLEDCRTGWEGGRGQGCDRQGRLRFAFSSNPLSPISLYLRPMGRDGATVSSLALRGLAFSKKLDRKVRLTFFVKARLMGVDEQLPLALLRMRGRAP